MASISCCEMSGSGGWGSEVELVVWPPFLAASDLTARHQAKLHVNPSVSAPPLMIMEPRLPTRLFSTF